MTSRVWAPHLKQHKDGEFWKTLLKRRQGDKRGSSTPSCVVVGDMQTEAVAEKATQESETLKDTEHKTEQIPGCLQPQVIDESSSS